MVGQNCRTTFKDLSPHGEKYSSFWELQYFASLELSPIFLAPGSDNTSMGPAFWLNVVLICSFLGDWTMAKTKFFELVEDINCIPAGVYRFHGDDDGIMHFSVGKSVQFFITADCQKSLRSVPERKVVKQRTTVTEFLDKYYRLLGNEPRPFITGDLSKPISYCMISPTVERGLH